VGFTLYLTATGIPEPRKANKSSVPRFLYASDFSSAEGTRHIPQSK